MGHFLGMNSRVRPKYKTKYRVNNWSDYDRALVQRGDLTMWISSDATDTWKPAPSEKRGGQRKFSDHAIETALALRLVFKLPLRQAEGFLRSVLSLMDLDLEAPDHTTLSRRSRQLEIQLANVPVQQPLHLIVDSTGLTVVGEGEWAAAKYGGQGRRGWKKLHLGVDRSGVIITEILTDANADDARTALGLIDEVDGDMTSLTADAAYDTIAIYEAAGARGAEVIVPPRRSATRSRRPSARDRTVMWVKKIGPRQWKKESRYHQQARVENAFFRYKSIIGDRLRARHPESQQTEALIACNILNRMTMLGRPDSLSIGGG